MQFAFKNWTVKMFAATATYHIMPCSSSYEQPRHPLSKIFLLFSYLKSCIILTYSKYRFVNYNFNWSNGRFTYRYLVTTSPSSR